MFPPAFDYHRATTVEEALDLLKAHGGDRERGDDERGEGAATDDGGPDEASASDDPDVAVLAGGHGLLPDAKAREAGPDVVVDVNEIDGLRGIEGGDHGDEVVSIGALTTHAALADSPVVAERATVLADAAAAVGDVQIRNRGTVGGNLVEADPAADLPPAMVAADATVALAGPGGERTVPAGEFFEGDGATAIGEGELLTEIRVPSAPAAGGAYAKKTHPASGFALVGVAATVGVTDWTVTNARVVATGATPAPVRLERVEDAVVGGAADDETVAAAAERAGEGLDPDAVRSDEVASAEFRRHLLSSYAERALTDAVDRATGRAATVEAGD